MPWWMAAAVATLMAVGCVPDRVGPSGASSMAEGDWTFLIRNALNIVER